MLSTAQPAWFTDEARYIGLSFEFAPVSVFYLVLSQPSHLRDKI